MNPWWKRPNPGETKGGRSRRSGRSQAEPSRLTDTLNEADQISEIDGDLFDDDDDKKPRKRKRRRRSGRRGGGKKLVGLVLCDVEALSHALQADDVQLEELLSSLWGDKTPKKMLAYAGSQADSRLCDDLAESGFQIAHLDDDQIAVQMAVDAWALLEELHPADSFILIADHPATVPLAQRLLGLERQTFVHRTDDNPLAELCGLEVARPAKPGDSKSDDQEDDRRDESKSRKRRKKPARSEEPSDSEERDEDSEDRDDSDDDDAPRRSRRGKRGSRSRRGKSTARRPAEDPMTVLDAAMRELVERGPMMVWATLVRQECLRQSPGFDETAYGFESFQQLLEAAAEQGRIELTHVEETDSWVVSAWSPAA